MEIEIWACCYSEKADVSISFGTSIDSSDGDLSYFDTDWIFAGMSDSFWENHEEFEAGIAQAEVMKNNDDTLTFHQALFAIFGDFTLCYEVNGEEMDLAYDFDVNASMYALLET